MAIRAEDGRAGEWRKAVLRSEPCPRRALADAAANSGYSLAELSRVIGRADGYLPRFVREGCPAALSRHDHAKLAAFLGIHQPQLGIRELWRRAA